jgi:hypothetical protein
MEMIIGCNVQDPEYLTIWLAAYSFGTLSEPEALKADLGTYETIGKGMATDCREGTNHIWGHPLLSHNGAELERLRPQILPILFQLP